MKRFLQITLLLCSMLFTTVEVGAWKFTSDPASGEVESLNFIKLTHNQGANCEYSVSLDITGPNGTEAITFTGMDNDCIYASNTGITTPGTYTLTIPANKVHPIVGYVNIFDPVPGEGNEAQTITWTIKGSQGGGQGGDQGGDQGGGQGGSQGSDQEAQEIANACTVNYDATSQHLTLDWPTGTNIAPDFNKTPSFTIDNYSQNINAMIQSTDGSFDYNRIHVYLWDPSVGTHNIHIKNYSFNGVTYNDIVLSFTVPAPETVDLTIDEDDADAVSKITAQNGETVNFKSNRTLAAGKWNTLCLPFAVPYTDFTQIIYVSKIEETSNNMFTVTFAENDSYTTIPAGTPALVQVAENKTIAYDEVEINDKEPIVNLGDGFYFTGSYAPKTLNGQYYISNDMFYYADVDIQMNGFRAYIEVPSGVANVRSFAINIEDGATTAIEEMEATGAKTATVTFDLSGKVVSNKKGIVIENGKKVMY